MWNKGFEGWYFKHQKGDDMISFIPGRAEGGAFVQMISTDMSRQFEVPGLSVDGGVIRAGECQFSQSGCKIDLPGVRGEIAYGPLTPLGTDIMGPFRFFPMQCRHGVISMAHALGGSLSVDGERHNFDGGTGYLEKDSGTSFPRSYLWLQCNDFPESCDLMVSIAHIPFCGRSFTGCICAIVHDGREYRFATYDGVRIHAAGPEHICLSQGKLLLEIDLTPARSSHPLHAPVQGKMSGTVRESTNVEIHMRLWERGKPVIDQHSNHAAYEYVPPAAQQRPEN